MRIAFLGDSITKGIPKVSYFKLLEERLKNHKLINYGKGGDTVQSLYRRIKRLNHIGEYDIVIVFVGVNDVYSKINKQHEFIKSIRRQYWSKTDQEFRSSYLELINYLDNKCKNIVVIPPLLFGENLKNKFNEELSVYREIIKDIISSYPHVTYLDVYDIFEKYLRDKETVEYLPESLYRTGMDVAVLRDNQSADKESESRGLHLTLDGVHLNSRGASILSEEIIKHIKQ